MLQKLRQFSKSWISSLFLGILSLAFVSWGVGDILQGHTDTAVIRVGKTAVDQTDFQRDYNNYLRNLGAQRGGTISPETAKREHIPDTLVQQTVLSTALDNVVKHLELTASDSLVMTRIRAMPQFAGLNGAFDRNAFQQLIERYGYTEKSFIEQVRADFARAQLETAVEGGFTMPVGYARAIMAFASEQRAADYVVVNDSGLAPIAAPSDAVLTAYARTHVGSYSTPEYRDVTFAKLSPEDIAASLNVTDAQIKRAYDARHEQYVIAEKRSVERLTFPDQKAAAEAKAKIDAGQSFADAAKSRGFAQKDITLGDVVAADLDKGEAKEVFAVKDGGVTAPVKSTFGWNIYHVTKIIPGKVTPIEQAHDELKAQVQKELARAKLDDVSNAYTDAVTSGLSLAEAAKKAGLTTIHVTAIDRDGLKPDGTKAAAPDDAEFRALIFKSEIGEEGDPVLTKAGTLYVIQVNGTVPPKLKPLDQVRDKVLAAWTAEERAKLLRQRVGQLVAQANRSGSLDAAAKSVGASVQHSKVMTRQTADATFSADTIRTFFAAAPGATVYGTLPAGGGYVIARVTAVAHRLPPENSPDTMRAVMAFSQSMGSDLTTSFAYAARDKQGVKINQKLLDSTVGKGEGS